MSRQISLMCTSSHRYTKETEGDKIDVTIIRMTFRQGIDHLVETEGHHIEVEEILVRIIDKMIEGHHKTIFEVMLEEKIIQDKGTGIEVVVEIFTETITEKVLGMTIEEIVMMTEIGIGQDKQVPYLEGRIEEMIVE